MKFSVLMSVYDKEKSEYLRASLQSLADQSVISNELILVEDGPINAELSAVIEEFREMLNIKSVRLSKNSGLAIALNEGLQHCSHELVARMDTDDIALPYRFEKQVEFMSQNPDIAVSSAWVEEFSDDSSFFSVRRLPSSHQEITTFAKSRNPISHPVSIFRKSIVEDVGGYPGFKKSQDYALWSLMLSRNYRFANIQEILLKMRAGNNLMGRRGISYFLHELKILRFQRKIGFINKYEYIRNLLIRFVVRVSPVFVKNILYKYARN